MKKTIILIFVFVVSFSLFNLTPIIPVRYETGATGICTLNSLSCINSTYSNDFPQILTSDWWTFFILPFLLPLLITDLMYRFIYKKMSWRARFCGRRKI